MMRFTVHSLKATLPCRAQLIPNRRPLFLTVTEIRKHFVQRSFVQSAFHFSVNKVECVSKPAARKCKNLSETVENVEEIKKKESKEAAESEIGDVKNLKEIATDLSYSTSITNETLKLFREMSGDNEEMFNELKVLQMKVDTMSKIYGVKLHLTREKWLEFLQSGRNLRVNYLSYLISNAIKDINKVKSKYNLPMKEDFSENNLCFDDPMCYHLFHNSMFLKFRVSAFRKRLYSKLMASILFSPEIFIDCSYDNYMNTMESKYLGKQIIDCMTQNFQSNLPYNLILCNYDKKSKLAQTIARYSNLFYKDYYPITLTEKSYIDLYPREKLVYLTPHCDIHLKEIVPDKRYIIGGYVDKMKSQQISLAKAKENQIAMAKFPLDWYLNWQKGKKNLCVNHVFSIMLNLKNNNNDWIKALEIIPKRCITKSHVPKPAKKSNIYENAKLIFSLGGGALDREVLDIDLEE